MKLVLMYFDKQKGPIAFDVIPKEISKEKESVLGRLFDVSENEGFFEHQTKIDKQPLSCANYLFYIDSPWARGQKEMAMMSLIDIDAKPSIFEPVLQKFATAIKSIKESYKAFYAGSGKDEKGSEKALKLIKLLITDCYEACRRKPEAQKPGTLLILGLKSVGKSSIINQVTMQKFNPNILPTLGKQLIKSAIDNFKFNIYDLGGQDKIRKDWYNQGIKPDAIIFVVDASATKADNEEAKREFDRLVEHYFGTEKKIASDTPVLILGNKIDLNPSFTEKSLETLLRPAKTGINYRLGVCSALNNEGLEDAFKWLVKAFLFV